MQQRIAEDIANEEHGRAEREGPGRTREHAGCPLHFDMQEGCGACRALCAQKAPAISAPCSRAPPWNGSMPVAGDGSRNADSGEEKRSVEEPGDDKAKPSVTTASHGSASPSDAKNQRHTPIYEPNHNDLREHRLRIENASGNLVFRAEPSHHMSARVADTCNGHSCPSAHAATELVVYMLSSADLLSKDSWRRADRGKSR